MSSAADTAAMAVEALTIHRRRLTGDGHAFELEDVLVEQEVVRARAGRDQEGLAPEADDTNQDRHRTGRNTQPVGSVGSTSGAGGLPELRDDRVGDRLT